VSGQEQVLVPVVNDAGIRQGEESLPVAVVGPARFRLLASPGFVEGLAAGDEFVLDDDVLLGYRVLERGGNLCVWLYFAQDVSEHGAETDDVRRAVEGLGGWLDGGWSRMLVFTVPLTAGFPAVDAALDAAVARIPGASWAYGNVYDPRDGATPLNWWLR
jgi:hypothetical protein